MTIKKILNKINKNRDNLINIIDVYENDINKFKPNSVPEKQQIVEALSYDGEKIENKLISLAMLLHPMLLSIEHTIQLNTLIFLLEDYKQSKEKLSEEAENYISFCISRCDDVNKINFIRQTAFYFIMKWINESPSLSMVADMQTMWIGILDILDTKLVDIEQTSLNEEMDTLRSSILTDITISSLFIVSCLLNGELQDFRIASKMPILEKKHNYFFDYALDAYFGKKIEDFNLAEMNSIFIIDDYRIEMDWQGHMEMLIKRI